MVSMQDKINAANGNPEFVIEPIAIDSNVTINNVEHPAHYKRNNAIECIDEMELVFGPEATAHFCLLSTYKYRYRVLDKSNPEEDMAKSDWYMQKYKELRKKYTQRSFPVF